MLASILFLGLQAAADEAGPLLNRQTSHPGPDGNVAVEGVLRRRFCFQSPAAICVPAGSTVLYTVHRGGPHSTPPADAGPPAPVLRRVDASGSFDAFGLSFAAHRPTPQQPDPEEGQRRHSLEVLGDSVQGILARDLSFAGVPVGAGHVQFYVDRAGALAGVAEGRLAADVQAGSFLIPKGSLVSVCPDGVQHARAPSAWRPTARAITAVDERHDEIAAIREGHPPGAVVQVPWGCAQKRLGWTAVSRGQVVVPQVSAEQAPRP